VAASYNRELDEKERVAQPLNKYNRHNGVWWFECEKETTSMSLQSVCGKLQILPESDLLEIIHFEIVQFLHQETTFFCSHMLTTTIKRLCNYPSPEAGI